MKRTNLLIILLLVLLVFAAFVGYILANNKSEQTTNTNQQTNQSVPSRGASLDMSGKQLTTLPESVTSRTEITSLNLSNNQLTSLDGIEKLTNLETLNVENNRLESLPMSISQLIKLKNADFSNNRLTSLPTELGSLTQLQVLNLNSYKGEMSDLDALQTKLPNTEIKR